MVQEDCPDCIFGCAQCKWTGVRPATVKKKSGVPERARQINLESGFEPPRKTKPTLH